MTHAAFHEELLACAVAAACAAGEHARSSRHRRREAVARTDHDVKLALDIESQAIAEGAIRARYPAHDIFGEERGARGDGRAPQWIIDPIDGTVNFSHGLPYWCSSVAVQVAGETVAGAVYAPDLGRMFTATLDGDSRCNGEVIRVSDVAELRQALVFTGISKTFDQYPESGSVLRAVGDAVQKIRLMGAAALDLCLLAQGEGECYFESGLNIWDVAAAELIVRRAGGHAATLAVLPSGRLRYVACNASIKDEFFRVLARYPAWMNPDATPA